MEKGVGLKLTEEEFNRLWDNQIELFKGKTDFAHQYITMSTTYIVNYALQTYMEGVRI